MPMCSYIRILQASPDAPPVDIYVNDSIVAKNLAFKGLTEYLNIPPGNYKIEVFPTGQRTEPVVYTNLTIPFRTVYIIAATGNLSDLALYPIPEEYDYLANGRNAYIRFVHLSPGVPPVNITLPNGNKLFEDVEYEEYTGYIRVNPGVYTLQVQPTGSDQVVLTVPDLTIEPGEIYSVYALGLVSGQPPLEAMLVNDNRFRFRNNG